MLSHLKNMDNHVRVCTMELAKISQLLLSSCTLCCKRRSIYNGDRPLSFAALLDSWGRDGEKRVGESENERGIKEFLVGLDEFASVTVGVRCASQCRIHTRWRGCERLNTGCGQIFSNINQIHNNLQVSVPNIQKYLQFTPSGGAKCRLGKNFHKYLQNIFKISINPCAKYSPTNTQ